MARTSVDDLTESLLPHVEKGDIIIDGGNSHYPDTNRRTRALPDDARYAHTSNESIAQRTCRTPIRPWNTVRNWITKDQGSLRQPVSYENLLNEESMKWNRRQLNSRKW